MPGFFDKVKEGAEKAAFEAERQRRILQAQSELRGIEKKMEETSAALGKQVLALYDGGGLTQPELVAACQQVDAVRQQIVGQQQKIEQIRAEKQPVAGAAKVVAARTCANCGSEVPAAAAFCPKCGTPYSEAAPPKAPTCPRCGAEVPAGAMFCARCGAPMQAG